MEEKLHQTFEDFFTDKDGDYSKARFLALALELKGEGRRFPRVLYGMIRAAYTLSADHQTPYEHNEFAKYMRDFSIRCADELEEFCQDLEERKKREMD